MRRFSVAALTLAACGGDSTGPTNNNLVGTYQLQTVNGSPLPYTAPNGDQLLGGGGVVRGDGTYDAGRQWSTAGGGSRIDSVGGNWSGSGNTGRFSNWFDGSTAQGSLRGTAFAVTSSSLTAGYQKQ